MFRFLTLDPWASHARLVVAQHRLLLSQQAERGLVHKGYEQVERLEMHRMVCWKTVVDSLLDQYAAINKAGMHGPNDGTPVQHLRGVPWPTWHSALVDTHAG